MARAKSWADYWRENMESVGLSVPLSGFVSEAKIQALIFKLVDAINKFGSEILIGTLIGVDALDEQMKFASSFSAGYYAEAMIGSSAYATGRCSCYRVLTFRGTTLSCKRV